MDNYSWDQPVSKSSESSELLNGKINISLAYQILPFFFFFVFSKAMKLARKTKKPQQQQKTRQRAPERCSKTQ
jgi:hypothetical protein